MKLLIGGDLVPTESNFNLFKESKVEELFGEEILKILDQVDFRIFNLEVPLSDIKSPIEKCGPNLIAPKYTINGIKALNPSFFTLGNNHILDHGIEGLKSTIDILDKNNIAYSGVGNNQKDARKPYICKLNNISVGIYCCCEHEFSVATENSAGANLFDPFESLDDINALKSKCDYVIVLYHGGKEHYRYPSPYLQKVCRKIIDKGADLVVCQHSHCIGCKEDWNNGTIVYGQGNFLFDRSDSEFWQTGLLVQIDIDEQNKKTTIDYIPLTKVTNRVRCAVGKQKEQILHDFCKRTEDIEQQGFIQKEYERFAALMINSYLNIFVTSITNNFIFRVVNKLTGYRLRRIYFEKAFKNVKRLSIENYIECEAHRELFIMGLKK